MFARFVELTVKADKKPELLKRMREDIMPVLKTCRGFFDLIPLEVEAEPTKFFAVSLWHEKYDAERYEKEYFPKIKQMIDPFLTVAPVVKLCRVDATIPEKVITVAA